ncbi:hypothetical protein, partial [Paractinoplanes brasiliensis]|uniref:hypothetical protein n=1 Tax=Paractinoplanes brasiliensis TaxID=52695 RepID=UPI001944DFA8
GSAERVGAAAPAYGERLLRLVTARMPAEFKEYLSRRVGKNVIGNRDRGDLGGFGGQFLILSSRVETAS